MLGQDLHPRIALVFAGWANLLRGDAKAALQKLQQAGTARPTVAEVTALLTRSAQRLNAEIQEKLGDPRATFTAYQQLNSSRTDAPDVVGFRRRLLTVAKLDVPTLPPEERANWVTMTGFPRSGTTLLENALGIHPDIETFEELPTRAAMQLYLDRTLPQAKTEPDRVTAFVEARNRYYDEMERRRKKPGASIFVDKSPIRSADAGFMIKAFPAHRYIFSIRHPFDVVLSCFKQAMAPNMAMENFSTIEAAVNLYDFTMTQWFNAFSMDDPRIHYLKYDDLVMDFEPRMREVLHFLGAVWNDAVLDFAAAAGSRASLTPSYRKVRQGLSLGVQTSWRKYPFVFQSQVAAPLKKWADLFGYPSK
jgi:sulfotransferase family protein